jgi:hypothetical protein
MVRYREIVKETINNLEKDEILSTLYDHFNISGTAIINDDGTVDIRGDCAVRKQFGEEPTRLLVRFNKVLDSFTCFDKTAINTLYGSPVDVGDFTWINSGITSLQGSPRVINASADFRINKQLVSIEGYPDVIKGHCDFTGCTNLKIGWEGLPNCKIAGDLIIPYHENLPLLRTLAEDYYLSKVKVSYADDDHTSECCKILRTYSQGQTEMPRKKAIYDCQYSLIKAGYKGNAKW